ncbi:MAG TPA: discoidin domain-containing protein, partial [Polyangiaceae bacterium]
RGKATTASTEESGNPSSFANDGVSTTRWAAFSGALPQWWRVDLGRVCTLQSYTLTFQWPDREYFYTIETSTDGSTFANPQAKSGTGLQTGAFPATQARYVRVTVTASNPASFASLFEVSIQGY